MGSSETNRNPFAVPYYSYRDCSIGLCTAYCPQFCYLAFPPPPQDGSNPSSPFTPLIIATLVVLSGAFLLVSYYLIVTRYCKSRATRTSLEQAETHNNANSLQSSQSGLDKTLIRAIAVRRYRKGDGSIEATECAVCLSEFEEDEPLRLLPKCSHAFHLPCIDSWLESHSNCPLCRAGVVVVLPDVESSEATMVASFNHADAYESQRRAGDDLALVVNDDREDGGDEHRHVVLSVVNECNEDNGDDDVNVKKSLDLDNHHNGVEEERGISGENVRNEGLESASKLKRSASLGAIRSETVKIALVCEDGECDFGIGSSKGSMRMKRSVSTGR